MFGSKNGKMEKNADNLGREFLGAWNPGETMPKKLEEFAETFVGNSLKICQT